MAGYDSHGTAEDDGGPPPEVDIAAHEGTFDAFVNLTKWTVVFIVLLLTGMAVFLL